jgi:hypothetical protein
MDRQYTTLTLADRSRPKCDVSASRLRSVVQERMGSVSILFAPRVFRLFQRDLDLIEISDDLT